MRLKAFEKKIITAKTVAVDTMLFIYLLEGHKTYFPLVKLLFSQMQRGRLTMVSSYIAYLETLSSPFLDAKRIFLYSQFFLKAKNLKLIKLDSRVASWAAFLRRKYGLRTPDAIQAATSLVVDANLFVSNDKVFKQVEEIKTFLLKDFI